MTCPRCGDRGGDPEHEGQCGECGRLTPEQMDELAGYPLDHKLMGRFAEAGLRGIQQDVQAARVNGSHSVPRGPGDTGRSPIKANVTCPCCGESWRDKDKAAKEAVVRAAVRWMEQPSTWQGLARAVEKYQKGRKP